MLTHVVIFKWIDGVTGEQVKTFREELNRMVSQLAATVTVEHGPDRRFRDGNGDYALVISFQDREAWQAYQSDPAHKAFISEFVSPIVSSRTSIQF